MLGLSLKEYLSDLLRDCNTGSKKIIYNKSVFM